MNDQDETGDGHGYARLQGFEVGRDRSTDELVILDGEGEIIHRVPREDTEDCRSYEEVRLQKLEERQADMIHVAELRELVEKWRDSMEVAAGDHQISGMNMALDRCAQELKELIEDG